MAITEKIVDDETHEPITYPYISARSIRVELSPTRYVWMGHDELIAFKNGINLGKWAEKRFQDIIEDNKEPEIVY